VVSLFAIPFFLNFAAPLRRRVNNPGISPRALRSPREISQYPQFAKAHADAQGERPQL